MLVRDFAKAVVKTRIENKSNAIERLNIRHLNRQSQENELHKDLEYLEGLILRSMLFMFVEFFGYALYYAFGHNIHDQFEKILNNGTLFALHRKNDLARAREVVDEESFEPDDILMVLWVLYKRCVSELVNSGWLGQWQNAPNRSKFIYADTTRVPMIREFMEADKMFQRGKLMRHWSILILEKKGISEYLRSVLS